MLNILQPSVRAFVMACDTCLWYGLYLQENSKMKRKLHPIAGVLAILIIAAFWVSTLGSELFGTEDDIRTVKLMIPWGFLVLIPSLVLAGGTGHVLGRGRTDPLIARKSKRMPFIAVNGIVILIPAALFLAHKADAYVFDATFYAVQVLELVMGALNIALLGLNLVDGRRLTGPRVYAGP